MGLVALRGAVLGEAAGDVAIEAIMAMFVFAGVGAGAGWIADILVRDSLEGLFRKRVDWYRQGLIDSESITGDSSKDD
jgi:hypothetical protein